MLLVGHYTHEWVWKTYLRMLLTFFDNRKTLDEHCEEVLTINEFTQLNNFSIEVPP